ncbi:MAG: hypothetical protein Q4B70_18530, partial [Lachnospiraceae bacterium]|nr:hypothetical protein [Lachnospiraceae bacterium]
MVTYAAVEEPMVIQSDENAGGDEPDPVGGNAGENKVLEPENIQESPSPIVTDSETSVPENVTNLSSQLKINITEMGYYNNDKKEDQVISSSDENIDLSDVDILKTSDWYVNVQLKVLSDIDSRTIKTGDTVEVALNTGVINVPNTVESQNVYLADGTTVVGSYVVSDGILTFTFDGSISKMEKEEFAGFKLAFSINNQGLSDADFTTETITLQDENIIELKWPVLNIENPSNREDNLNEEKKPVSNGQISVVDTPSIDEINEENVGISTLAETNQSSENLKKTADVTIADPKKLPHDGIEFIQVGLNTAEDGYTSDSVGKNVVFSFLFGLKNDYMEEILNEYAYQVGAPDYDDYLTESDPESAYENAMYTYLLEIVSQDKLIKFDYDLGSIFADNTDPEMQNPFSMYYNEFKIGTATVTKDSDGNSKLSVEFNGGVFAFSDVVASLEASLMLDENQLSDKVQYVDLDDGKAVLKSDGGSGEQESDNTDSKCKLSKEAPSSVSSREFDYKIEATGDDLTGWTLKDSLAPGLEVVSVKQGETVLYPVSQNDGNTVIIEPVKDENGKVISQKLSYTIPKTGIETPSAPIKTATFTVRVRIDDETYNNNSGNISSTYKNKASIEKEENGSKTTVDSNEVSTSVNITSIKKEGSQNSLNGRSYSWKIDTNIYLPNNADSYLIDTFDYDIHKLT